MEKKQTAIEWFDRWFRDNPEATHEEGNKALQKAKQMEKEQIVNAWETGAMTNYGDAKTYYDEIYGKETS